MDEMIRMILFNMDEENKVHLAIKELIESEMFKHFPQKLYALRDFVKVICLRLWIEDIKYSTIIKTFIKSMEDSLVLQEENKEEKKAIEITEGQKAVSKNIQEKKEKQETIILNEKIDEDNSWDKWGDDTEDSQDVDTNV